MPNIVFYNIQENVQVHSPCLVIHGKCSSKAAKVQAQHPQLPTLFYDVNNQFFKATVNLTPGENKFTFVTDTNLSQTLTCFYTPLLQNIPVHLCLLLARDSPGTFDSPKTQIQREGGNDLALAIKKLRVGARLMQAFTNEQMLRNGFGHRTFNFAEEWTMDTSFRQDTRLRDTVKIHVIRSDKTVKELRDPNLAQQNPNGNNTGGLFGIAMEALRNYGGPFTAPEKPVQAAVLFLDTHWDPNQNLILAHAALGGGDSEIKLAIFGSHGLYSWPSCFEDVPQYFTDTTRISTKEVANDCNECSSHWECLTVTLGAFMHEIGHLLGCPHQESGVMLRDYVTLNRSFLTKEAFSVRTNSDGAQPPIYPREECTWHRLDSLRFLYHPSFTLPQDYYDPSFMRPGKLERFTVPPPTLYPMGNNCAMLKSETGIYCIEIICGDLARAHIEYLPQSLGGMGPQREILLSLDDMRSRIPPDHLSKHGNDFKLKVHAVNSSDADFDNFPKVVNPEQIPMSKFGFSSNVTGIKSMQLGDANRGSDFGIVAFDVRKVTAVRVYHGAALDGIRLYLKSEMSKQPPVVPPRTYVGKITNALKSVKIQQEGSSSVLFGKETNGYTDLVLENGEYITGFNVRCGAWIDAIQLLTNYGKVSEMFGNKNGGGQGELIPPQGQYILGLYGRVGQWVDAIGIVYGSL